MEPSIPLPTDNAYKFAALFRLALFISSIVGLMIAIQNHQDFVLNNSDKLANSYLKESFRRGQA
jgi:hypothetical protein